MVVGCGFACVQDVLKCTVRGFEKQRSIDGASLNKKIDTFIFKLPQEGEETQEQLVKRFISFQ